MLLLVVAICLTSIKSLTEAGSCNYTRTTYTFDITCSRLNSKTEYLDEIYKMIARSSVSSITGYLQIEDSNFPELGPWITAPFTTSVAQSIYSFTLRNAGVKAVLPGTFANFRRLSYLDLGYNQLDQYSFMNENTYFSNIYLNNNNFSNTFDLTTVNDTLLEYLGVLDLSNNNIEKFVNSPGRAIELRLSNNSLTDFELVARAPSLDLSYNNIAHYIENTYMAIDLNIGYNKELSSLTLTPSQGFSRQLQLEGDSNLKKIKTSGSSKISVILDLSHSTGLELTTNFLEDMTVTNTLNLSYIAIPSLQKSTLDLSANIEMRGLAIDMSHTNISDIEEYYFRQYSIRSLNLTGNKLKTIKSYTFESSVISDAIIISDSQVSIVENEAFQDVSTQKLSLANNDITEVNFLNNITVVELDLSNNPIKSIDDKTFANCNNLQILKLTNSFISKINPSSLSTITRLTQLEISFAGSFNSTAIENLSLQRLSIVNSSLSLSANNFRGLYNLVELYFNNSEIKSFDAKSLKGLFKLQYLDTSQLFKNSTTVPSNFFEDLNSLKYLNLSHLKLDTIQSNAFVGLNALTELYLNDNKIASNFFADSLNGLPNLKVLHFENNDLYTTTSGRRLALSNLENLEELYLSGNRLVSLDVGIFSGLANLKKLDLSNNRLSYAITVPVFFPLKRLQILNLESNAIGSLYDYELLLKVLPFIDTIALGNNSMSCSDVAGFLYQLKTRTIDSVFFNVAPQYSPFNVDGVKCLLN